MTDLALAGQLKTDTTNRTRKVWLWGVAALTVVVALLVTALALTFTRAEPDAPLVVNSTLGQLGLWMAAQSEEDNPRSLLGQYAKDWAQRSGAASLEPAVLLNTMRNSIIVISGAAVVLLVIGAVGLLRSAIWSRRVLMLALLGLVTLLFIVSPESSEELALILAGIFLILIILLAAPGKVTKLLGFVVVLSALLVTWETFKAFAAWADYRIVLPQPGWTYTAYPTLDDALQALESGETDAVIADRKELDAVVPPVSFNATDSAALPYPGLRLLDRIEKDSRQLGLPLIPAFPGRLAVVARTEDESRWTAVDQLVGQRVGAVEGSFAADRLLAPPRQWMLVDLSIGNDLNLPHLQSIAKALFQPARRNGPLLLLRILVAAAQFTWTEALMGFTAGGLLGFALGTLFAHSKLMERGLLPYVVASQTIPILAIAPMVVIWLGASPVSVAVISAYLTFFPVTINTLRGLKSPHPTALELMQSYAASPWTILWKLRLPAALPYIFTALKVSATASVVGAIIGELPSGIGDGLGRAILDFNQYYTSDPAKLWAAIFIAALVGIGFFVIVGLAERWLMPKRAALE